MHYLPVAFNKIEQILKDHDLAGFVLLATPDQTQGALLLEAPWNDFKQQITPEGVVLGYRQDLGRPPVPDTLHEQQIEHMRKTLRHTEDVLGEILVQLREQKAAAAAQSAPPSVG